MQPGDAVNRAREIARDLYPHQVEGVGFLLGRRRSILADDMGLGKTRQSVIAMTQAEPAGPWLVVCPASVKHNWVREIGLALGEAETRIVGPGPPPPPGFTGWIVVNYYDLLKRDIEALLDHPFAGIVFDEGHYLRPRRPRRGDPCGRPIFRARRCDRDGTSPSPTGSPRRIPQAP